MDEKLDLCKYCEHSVLIDETEHGDFYIECTGCGLTTATFPRRNQLVRYWNFKPQDGSGEAIIEKLKTIETLARESKEDVHIIRFIAEKGAQPELKELPPT